MPLCFTDLSIGASSNNRAVGDRSSGGGTAALFVREENKKTSFALQHPYKLNDHTSDHDHQNGNDVIKSTKHNTHDDSDSLKNKSSSSAMASISSCISNTNNSENETIHFTTYEVFLFGGFELLTNVKTVEVYVTRSTDTSSRVAEEETYLTTCKGVPIRDLPPLSATPRYIDDGMEGEAKGTLDMSDERVASGEEEDQNVFYKFILVSPGGPKPVQRVRLKFVRSNTLPANENRSIIVHTLKVKGRLADSISTSTAASQQQSSNMMQQISNLPVGSANISSGGIPNNDVQNGLASMMAMVGGGSNGLGSMPMAMQMSPQLLTQQNMQSSNQQQYIQQQQQQQQHLHNNHQQEKNQAEILSSIAGLGMYFKSTELRTSKKVETMISDMEIRIMKRLDILTERLDVIEQSINKKEQCNKDDDDEIGWMWWWWFFCSIV